MSPQAGTQPCAAGPGLSRSVPTHNEEHGCQEGDEGDVVGRLSGKAGRAHQGLVGNGTILRSWHKVDIEPHSQAGD